MSSGVLFRFRVQSGCTFSTPVEAVTELKPKGKRKTWVRTFGNKGHSGGKGRVMDGKKEVLSMESFDTLHARLRTTRQRAREIK